MIERFFRDLEQSIMAIGDYIDRQNDNEALPMDRQSQRHTGKRHTRPNCPV